MFVKDPENDIRESENVKDKKIQYGESQIVCFACGEKIDFNTDICPYCNTKQIEKDPKIK